MQPGKRFGEGYPAGPKKRLRRVSSIVVRAGKRQKVRRVDKMLYVPIVRFVKR
jgi:hypothetical protein